MDIQEFEILKWLPEISQKISQKYISAGRLDPNKIFDPKGSFEKYFKELMFDDNNETSMDKIIYYTNVNQRISIQNLSNFVNSQYVLQVYYNEGRKKGLCKASGMLQWLPRAEINDRLVWRLSDIEFCTYNTDDKVISINRDYIINTEVEIKYDMSRLGRYVDTYSYKHISGAKVVLSDDLEQNKKYCYITYSDGSSEHLVLVSAYEGIILNKYSKNDKEVYPKCNLNISEQERKKVKVTVEGIIKMVNERIGSRNIELMSK